MMRAALLSIQDLGRSSRTGTVELLWNLHDPTFVQQAALGDFLSHRTGERGVTRKWALHLQVGKLSLR